MEHNKYYAGIGSRTTPYHILDQMRSIASKLANKKYTLRSGKASGADTAFEKGALSAGGALDLYTYKDTTLAAMSLVSTYHPAWHLCSDYSKLLLGRNAQIILGYSLDKPVDFVVCWTPRAALLGGTAIGIKIAMSRNISVYNLADPSNLSSLMSKITPDSDL